MINRIEEEYISKGYNSLNPFEKELVDFLINYDSDEGFNLERVIPYVKCNYKYLFDCAKNLIINGNKKYESNRTNKENSISC